MTDIFTQFKSSRRSMPEHAQKEFTMESSKDIVGSYLLDPAIDNNYSSAPLTTHEMLALQTRGKAKIDVIAQVEGSYRQDIESASMYLCSEYGSIQLRLRLPNAYERVPLSLRMETSSGREIVLFLPRTFHGRLHIKQRCTEGHTYVPRVFKAQDAPMISKEVMDASLSVQASDYEVLCDIRPSERRQVLGKDAAEVIARLGRVHVKFESDSWKGARALRRKSVSWKLGKKDQVECQTQ